MKVKLASDWFGPGGVLYKKHPDGGFTEIPARLKDKLPSSAKIPAQGERPVRVAEVPLDSRPKRGDGDPNVDPDEDLAALDLKSGEKDLEDLDPDRKALSDADKMLKAAEAAAEKRRLEAAGKVAKK